MGGSWDTRNMGIRMAALSFSCTVNPETACSAIPMKNLRPPWEYV